MSHHILDKEYKITDAAGVSAGLVVVQGTNAGECKLPTEANAGAILGVTIRGQTIQNQTVAVRKAGIARVVAAGPIFLGDPVNVAAQEIKREFPEPCPTCGAPVALPPKVIVGKVKRIDESSGTRINCLGFAETAAQQDGDVLEIFISLHERTA
jgi:hypothetical protein